MGIIGLILLIPVVAGLLFAPLLTPHDPTKQNILQRLKPPAWMEGGNERHLLGTDHLGRDILARVLYGGRISLLVGFASVLLSAPLGILIGLAAGYYRGPVDSILMRWADIQLAFPFMLLAIAVVAAVGPGLVNVIVVLGITGWMSYARVTRGQILSLSEQQFVEAAQSLGASPGRVLFVHLLPNILAPNLVIATYSIGYMIIIESSLSFLGLGVPPPTPTWGGMINDARNYLTVAWWVPVFPGIALILTVLGINLFGEWVRERLDPRRRTFQ